MTTVTKANPFKIEIHQGKNGDWYYTVKARNGRTISASEGYTRRWTARRAAEREFPGVKIIHT